MYHSSQVADLNQVSLCTIFVNECLAHSLPLAYRVMRSRSIRVLSIFPGLLIIAFWGFEILPLFSIMLPFLFRMNILT